MRPFHLGFGIISLSLVSACDPKVRIETVIVTPDVPEILRTPVTVPEREAETLADVGLILTDHVEALDQANGRITAVDCILDAAELGNAPDCEQSGR